jgi:hypothetical protein
MARAFGLSVSRSMQSLTTPNPLPIMADLTRKCLLD